MKHRVVVLRRAENDVRKIVSWIRDRSRVGAVRWYEAYEAALKRLEFEPTGYSLAEEAEDFPESILRQFLFKTRRGLQYRGVFIVVEDEVRVLRIRGSGQAPLTADELRN